jgi:hypothetical protein
MESHWFIILFAVVGNFRALIYYGQSWRDSLTIGFDGAERSLISFGHWFRTQVTNRGVYHDGRYSVVPLL